MTPPAVLVAQLAAARREGIPFEQAWPAALVAALASVPAKCERSEWSEALNGTLDAWRACFERRPAGRRERAVAALAHDPERVPLPERPCERCGEPIPPDRRTSAVYCSANCRLRAKAERERRLVAA